MLLAGCGIYFLMNKNSVDENNGNNNSSTASIGSSGDNSAEAKKADDNKDDNSSDITFEDLSKYYYTFSSGAGGWSDDFSIEKDGYFHGSYHDSEMGDTSDEHPNGSVYFCQYEGHFENIQKIDEYTFSMTMKDIKVTNDQNEYVEDGMLFIPSEPYALNNAKEVQIYLPGKPVDGMDEELQMWLSINYQDQKDTVEKFSLVNVNENQGITTCERMSAKEEAQSSYDSAKNSYDYYGQQLQEATATPEMVEITGAQVKEADYALNDIWRLVKYNVDEDTYNKALAEQRQWLKDRDAQAEKDAAEFEGGTFEPVMYNDTVASMTLERCKELLKYFE